MKVKELYSILNELIPPSLSCDWDNDGYMCVPDGGREVRKILFTLDVTDEAADKAISEGFDLIISHHPMIFKGLKSISEDNFISAKAIKLISGGVSVFSFHTRLDALTGGVNDTLAELFGLLDTEAFGADGEEIGRVGSLPTPMPLADFAALVKEKLSLPALLLSDAGREVSRVAILGGEGSDDIRAAIAAGADTFLSGRLGYHNMTDAPEMGINLIEAGHFYTEYPVCETLSALIGNIAPTVERTVFNSNRIRVI